MAAHTFSPAERIRELGTINSDVPKMLESAGRAVNALTNRPVPAAAEEGDDALVADNGRETAQAHREVFESSTQAFYEGLQAIIARLRRQAYALEEAGIIAVEPPSMASSSSRPAQPTVPTRTNVTAAQAPVIDALTNGGLGKFDVGWLNSRGNKVGAEKEAELVQEARNLLESQLSSTANG